MSVQTSSPVPRVSLLRPRWVRIGITGLLVLALAASLGSLAWFLWQSYRPGARHYERGVERLAAKDPEGAVREWRLGAKNDPTDPRCFEMLGDFYTQAERHVEAAAAYERAARYAPQDGTLWIRLSDAYRLTQRQKDAAAAAKRAYELRPNDAEAVGRHGMALKGEKQRPQALALLRRAHELKPDDRRFFLAMIDLELDTLQLDQAEAHLRPYLERNPEDPEACFKMAVVFNQKPRTPENLKTAIRYAEKALPGMPHNPQAYSVMGQLYLDAGRTKNALQVFRIGRVAAPNAESVLRGLADCYTRLGMTKELAEVSAEFQKVLNRHDRIDHLTHVMGFNPNDTASGLELARLTEEEGLLPKALGYYEQLVRQAPNDPRTRKALSGFYARQGQRELAKKALQPDFVP